jgi:hypothetical protein
VSYGQQKAARREPASGIHDGVKHAAGIGIDDEAVDIAELRVVVAADVESVEVDV